MRGFRHATMGLVLVGLVGSALGCGIGDAQQRLRTAVDAKEKSLDECYAQALERNEGAQGDMSIWVHVSSDTGRVDSVEVSQSEITDGALQKCVETTLVGLALVPPPKANLKVEYTLRFVPNP